MTTVADLLRVAVGFHKAGALDDAERLYGRILAAVPEQPQALRLAGLAAHQNGRPGVAAIHAARLVRLDPRVTEAHNLQGAALYDAGATEAAVVAYRRALALDPQAAAPTTNLGTALRALGDLAGAVACQQRAVTTAPASPESWRNLGNALLETGSAGASASLRRAAALHPGHAGVLSGLARALSGVAPVDTRRRLLERADALAPETPGILAALGAVMREAGDPAADRVLWRALRLDPTRSATAKLAGDAARSAGRNAEASRALRWASVLAPGDSEPLHGLAHAARDDGESDSAERLACTAAGLDPATPSIWRTLGTVRWRVGRHATARVAYLRSIALQPGHAPSWLAVAIASEGQSDLGRSVRFFAVACALDPTAPETRDSLGVALFQQGDRVGAYRCFLKALALAPAAATFCMHVGMAYRAAGRADLAVPLLRRGVALEPRRFDAWIETATALYHADDLDRAAPAFVRALAVQPDNAMAYANLGLTECTRWRAGRGERALRRAVFLRPSHADAHNNLGTFYTGADRPESADAAFVRASALDPASRMIRFNLAFAKWKQRRLAEGHRLYDDGIGVTRQPIRDFPMARWRGEPLDGKRILVESEQGIGDEIRFASCYPDLIAAAGQVVLEVEPRLVGVMGRSFPAAEVRAADKSRTEGPGDADLWVPAGSLPRYLRPEFRSFPRSAGFLVPDPVRVAAWRARFAALPPGPRVGICWRSRMQIVQSFADITTLEMWREVLAVPGAVFVSLQYDRAEFELDAVRDSVGVEIHSWPDIDLMHDMEEAIALAAAVDLGISVAVSVNDQLGATGTECWLLWRGLTGAWGINGQPFYPRHRLMTRRFDESARVSLAKAAARLAHRVQAPVRAKRLGHEARPRSRGA